LKKTVDCEELLRIQKLVWDVHVDESLQDYIVRLVKATREHQDLLLGASPRGGLALFKTAQAYAALRDRDHVIPDDLQTLLYPTIAHRLILRPEAELRGRNPRNILDEIIKNIPLDLGDIK
jgi:MoxR-like ATPase